MAKILSPDGVAGSNEIAANNLVAVHWLPVSVVAWVVWQSAVWAIVDGISVENKTFSATNTTTVLDKLEFIRLEDLTELEFIVAWGLTQAKVGNIYNLNAAGNINAGVVWTQFRCIKFINATNGVFIRAK